MSGQNAVPAFPMAWAGIQELLSAWKYAADFGRSPSDFAVEIDALRQLGLGNSDLRWLICKGYVRHFIDQTHIDQSGRLVVSTESLRLVPASCFVLTPAGISIIESCDTTGHKNGDGQALIVTRPDIPSWNKTTRVLRLGAAIIAKFNSRAPAQERILAAFQEEEWPVRIDDPLPPNREGDQKTKLGKAIHRLNKHVNSPHIHFSSDGSGQGVCWHLNSEADCPAVKACRDEDQ